MHADDDPIFRAEQAHLTETYAKLQGIAESLVARLRRTEQEAAADKQAMSEELSTNLSSWDEAMETYAAFATLNRVVDSYNIAQEADERQLRDVLLLLDRPYFAKVALQFKPGEPAKELYIGAAGISDESYRRLIVDWRSPVAEVYYNQANGPTSYRANGRTIEVDLKLRRQFDIERDRLNACFDTTVAIEDPLLLASLTRARSAKMQDITATIQKEQNLVIRHEDVPTLLVGGIAGSGKTSVLLQRIAYLFFQQRGTLDPREVTLITPNPVFRSYINDVLPDLGERNPEIVVWDELAARLMPPDRSHGKMDVDVEQLWRIDAAMDGFAFEQQDFKDLRDGTFRFVTAGQIDQIARKFKQVPAGPHLTTLMRETLLERFDSRLAQMATTEAVLDEMAALSIEAQLDYFDETFDPQSEEEERAFARRYLEARYAGIRRAIERDEWIRIDRIGMRLLGLEGLAPVEWLYLKMAVTGMGDPSIKYVMVDEVQDYTAAQLAVLARYFRRAHFMLLGDEHQAIRPGTASFDEVRTVFGRLNGPVSECSLRTSYRSAPEITALFAGLLDEDERGTISSVRRPETAPAVVVCGTEETYAAELQRAIENAREDDGLTAIVIPWKHEAKRLARILGDDLPTLIDDHGALPASGVALITLQLAKGLEFDRVIVPDASARVFPDEPLARRCLYTTISRATREITVLAPDELTPLLDHAARTER